MIEFFDLGLCPYSRGREVQESQARKRVSGCCGDVIFFCQHLPTLTYTKRTSPSDYSFFLGRPNTEVLQVRRGGEATYHAPGQLVVYPVIHLKERRLGVRAFMDLMLESFACSLRGLGVLASSSLEPAGVWVEGNRGRSKIGQAGLQIVRGVTNHGFAINVDCDLTPFSRFVPCGMHAVKVTSVTAELGESPGLFERVDAAVKAGLRSVLA